MAGNESGVKRIIVACGSGVASSTLAQERIQDLLRKWRVKGVRVEVVDFKSAKSEAEHADLFINISPGGDTKYACPEWSGVPFMIGFGMEDHLKKGLALIGIKVNA